LSLLVSLAVPYAVQTTGTVSEKAGRTSAQRKIDTQLLYALYQERGESAAKGVPPPAPGVLQFDAKHRVLVSIRAKVTRHILASIRAAEGAVVSSSERYDDIRAYVPLTKIETLAALSEVRSIAPGDAASTNRGK
jgi:hypothetical protein